MPDDIAADRLHEPDASGALLDSAPVRARLPALVSFLAAVLLALNVVCLCPHAAGAAERPSEAAPAGHCAGGHGHPAAPAPDASRCPHCDEIGARLSQTGAERSVGQPPGGVDLAIAPGHASLRLAPSALAPAVAVPGRGVGPPAVHLRTTVLQI
jgi:hypothetical protein